MPYIGAKHLATKARGGLAFKSQIPVMPKHQGFYFFNFSHPDCNCRFWNLTKSAKKWLADYDCRFRNFTLPRKQARPAKGGPSMEWPQGGTPEESCPAYRGPVPNRHGITADAKGVEDKICSLKLRIDVINYLLLDKIISQ